MKFLLLLAALACRALPAVPTPESVLGHKPDDESYLTSYDDALDYFKQLAAASNRIKLVQVGKTAQGRDWFVACISNPENLAQLAHFEDMSRRLATARGLDDATARRMAHDIKPMVHIDGGARAADVASHQHVIQLGYDLVAREEPVYRNIRDGLIVELWISINPDGQNSIARRDREPGPQPDFSCDGYMLNLLETREITRATLETQPLLYYTHRDTAPLPGRIFLPPFADPISSNLHPLTLRWLNLAGASIAQYLDEHGLSGSTHQDTRDIWYPGSLDTIGNFRHTISLFSETAPLGGTWRLSAACRYLYNASMAILDLAARYREQMQYNKYRAARDTIQKFEKEPPYAYLIPREQHDAPTAAALVEKLMLQGIEVHRSPKPDAWVILMNQPFAGLVKELFEPQKYPAVAQPPGDVTGWTLPYLMDVEVDTITTPLTSEFARSLEKVDSIKGFRAPFNRNANSSFRAVNQILAAKGSVEFAGDGVSVSNLDPSRLDSILAENHLQTGATERRGQPVKTARTGVYRPIENDADEAWTRWVLEQFDFPFASVSIADLRDGHLRDRFDVIVFPDSDSRSISGAEDGDALRQFVNDGGTLIAFNNASLYAIEQFGLPVTNAVAGLNASQFSCSGCLLRVHVEDAMNPLTQGLSENPIVMFERSPVFETGPDFNGTVLARYSRDRSPLESGYLAGPERLKGKAAALEVSYGKGRIVLLGFRPLWRGESHGTYKFLFNALYLP